jgi:hypothetical protein
MTQVVPVAQTPQFRVPPQPSGAVPQVLLPQAWESVKGTQTSEHEPAVPLSLRMQGVSPGHVPQEMVPPQPSGVVPQLFWGQATEIGIGMQGIAHTRLTSTPSSNVRAFSFQSSSPHSRPT